MLHWFNHHAQPDNPTWSHATTCLETLPPTPVGTSWPSAEAGMRTAHRRCCMEPSSLDWFGPQIEQFVTFVEVLIPYSIALTSIQVRAVHRHPETAVDCKLMWKKHFRFRFVFSRTFFQTRVWDCNELSAPLTKGQRYLCGNPACSLFKYNLIFQWAAYEYLDSYLEDHLGIGIAVRVAVKCHLGFHWNSVVGSCLCKNHV